MVSHARERFPWYSCARVTLRSTFSVIMFHEWSGLDSVTTVCHRVVHYVSLLDLEKKTDSRLYVQPNISVSMMNISPRGSCTATIKWMNESSCDHRGGSSPAGWFCCSLGTCDPFPTPHHVTKLENELTKPQSLLHMCVISASVMAIKKKSARSSCKQPCSEVRPAVLRSKLSLVGQANKNNLKKHFTFSFSSWISHYIYCLFSLRSAYILM